MTIQTLTCFMAVAEALSYTKAASSLYISQPAVSKHIAALEEEFETQLFDKNHKRALKLTPSGQILYDSLKRCENDFSTAIDRIKALTLNPPLMVNLIEGNMIPDSIYHLFDEYQAEISPTQFTVKMISEKDISKILNHGEVVICTELSMPENDTYSSMTLYEDIPLYIIAHAQHNAFHQEWETRAEDFSQSTLFLSKGYTTKTIICLKEYLYEAIGMHVPLELTNNFSSTQFYLQAHRGFTIGTSLHVDFDSNKINFVQLPYKTNLKLLWKKEKIMNPYMFELLKKLKNELK